MSRAVGYARARAFLKSLETAVDDLRTGFSDDCTRKNPCYTPDMDDRTSAEASVNEGILPLAGYQPLGSVWCGEDDAELLEQLLQVYPRERPRMILDATVNGGRFWRGSRRKVVGVDIDYKHRPTVVADNASMPFGPDTMDVVVYDPPHIPNQGRDRSKDFNKRFGLGERSSKAHGYTFAHTYPPFMREAFRVLRDEGILLAKIADYVHNHRYQWAHLELIKVGQEVGFIACDCVIKVRKAPIIDPKWKVAHHTRRQHCYWIIFRKSHKCE